MLYNKKDELRFIKFSVYTMGLILMIGAIAITYIVYKRNVFVFKENKQQQIIKSNVCDTTSSALTLGMEVRQIIKDGDKLLILSEPNGDVQKIMIFDYCKNKVLNTIYIKLHDKNLNI